MLQKLWEKIEKMHKMNEYVLVSAFVTNSEKLKHLEKQWKKRDKEHKKCFGRSYRQVKELNPEEFGGSILLINPYNLKEGFISELPCPLATGMAYNQKEQYFLVGSGGKVLKINKCKIIEELKNNLFNDIHYIDLFNNRFLLISSTGTDSLVEIDLKTGKKTGDWLATENGFPKSLSGKIRTIDRTLDYSKIDTITPEHTTHINSATYLNKDKILALLFHQGKLILIDKKTGRYNILLENLKCPHNIRKTTEGYMLSVECHMKTIHL